MKIPAFNQFEQNGNIDPTFVEVAVQRWQEDIEAVGIVLQTPDQE